MIQQALIIILRVSFHFIGVKGIVWGEQQNRILSDKLNGYVCWVH